MRVILVDDEPIALDTLKYALANYEDVKVVGTYTDPKLALLNMETTKPDVIFLDIEMGPTNGLVIAEDFIEKKDSAEIVFITAYAEYAIEAFELNVIDYILKPIGHHRLDKTIKRLRDKIKSNKELKEKEEIEDVLKVECFGKLEVTNSSGKALNWRTRKSKELFSYLLLQKDRKALKDIIMETIFPEKELEKANTLLHTTIYQLRRNLKNLGFNKSITLKNGWYRLATPVEADFEELDKIINLKEHSVEDISKIINIYKGDFLEYEGYNWIFGTQQKYKESILIVLDNFTKDQLDNNLYTLNLIESLELMYKIEPYDENTVKNIIKYYGKQGQVKKLEDFFRQYKDNIWEDLNTEPLESTVELFDKYSR